VKRPGDRLARRVTGIAAPRSQRQTTGEGKHGNDEQERDAHNIVTLTHAHRQRESRQ
jgi:hypothetical protein